MAANQKVKSPSDCNCLNLRRAAQALTKVYDEAITSAGVSVSQYALLRRIDDMAPVSVSALSSALRLDRTTLVRTLKHLEDMALVEDIAEPGARNRNLVLTGSGQKILTAAQSGWLAAQNRIEAALGKAGLNQLTRLLSKIENL